MPMYWNKLNFPWKRYLPSSGDYEQKQSANAHKERQTLTQIDFSQGLNNVDDPTVIGERQVSDSKNMIFSSNYGMEKRHGTRILMKPNKNKESEAILANSVITFVDEYNARITDVQDSMTGNVPNWSFIIQSGYNKDDGQYYLWIINKFDLVVDDVLFPANEIMLEMPIFSQMDGAMYHGNYWFVDGKETRRFRYTGNGNFTIETLCSDPKMYITSIAPSDIEVVRNETKTTEEYIAAIGSEYSSNTDYYADAAGVVKLEHGEEIGKVNAENYKYYFVKQETQEENYEYIKLKSMNVKLLGLGENFQTAEDVAIALKTNPFYSTIAYYGYETVYSHINAEADIITGLVYVTYTTSLIPLAYEVDTVTPNNDGSYKITFHQSNNDEITYIKMDNAAFNEVAKKTSVDEIASELSSMLSDGNSPFYGLFRRYTPNPVTMAEGENKYMYGYFWYEPCMNDLTSPYYGENYIPDFPKILEVHKDKIYIAGDFGGYEVRGNANSETQAYFPINCALGFEATGDRVNEMFSFDGSLIVGRKNDMYRITGSSTGILSGTQYKIDKMDTNVGTMCRRCGSITNNYYMFLGSDGILYKMNTPTTNTEYLMVRPLSQFINLTKKPIRLSKEDMVDAKAVSFKNTVYWAIKDKIIVYSYDKQAFTYFSDLSITSWYTNGFDLYLYEGPNRMIVDKTIWADRVYGNERDAISCELRTRTYNINTANYKYWEQALITFAHGDYPKMGCYIQYIFDEDDLHDHETFSSSRFGASQWDLGTYNSDRSNKTFWFKIDAKSRQMTIRFYDSEVDNSFEVIDVSVLFTSRDVRK